MAINKIEFDSTILIDLTGDTVTKATLAQGIVAHDKSGNQIVGEFVTTNGSVSQDDDGYIVLNDGDGSGTPLVPLTVTQNGTYTAPSNTGYTPVTVSVKTDPTLQSKTASPTESVQTIVADNGYDGLSSVEVGAIASDYIGTSVPRKSASDLVVSGSFVNVEAGYYSSGVSKAVSAGSAAVPSKTLAFSPAISVDYSTGVIRAEINESSSISPTITSGYVSSGISGAVTVSGWRTMALATKSAVTVTPTSISQVVVESGKLTLGDIWVDAIPSAYVIPSGTLSITQGGTYDVTNYKSANVAVTDGRYSLFKNIMEKRTLVGEDSNYISHIGNLSSVGQYAFAGFGFGASAYTDNCLEFTNCSLISDYGFTGINLGSSRVLSFPNCSLIGIGAFCSAGGYFNLPACKSMKTSAFSNARIYSVNLPVVEAVETYAFRDCKYLSSINLPMCKQINANAFAECSISSINIPLCEQIGAAAFISCTKLTSIDAPKCSVIYAGAFQSCSKLTSINFPSVENIYSSAFRYCSALESAIFPECSKINDAAFQFCSSLTAISFPKCTYMGSSAFHGCKLIGIADFPKCENIEAGAFSNCSAISVVSFPACSYIKNYAFNNANRLESAYFLGDSVPTLQGAYVFNTTPLAISTYIGRFGSIFVKQSMLDSFKTAQYWSSMSARMVGLTDEEIAAL